MEEKKIRDLINAYSRNVVSFNNNGGVREYTHEGVVTVKAGKKYMPQSSHPYQDYGDHVSIKVNDECPIRICRLTTQYESRTVYKFIRPYLGKKLVPCTCESMESVKPWNFDLDEPNDFVDKSDSYDVEGSQWKDTCQTCKGKGDEQCYKCYGKGRMDCPDCQGRGEWRCGTCDGSGRRTCSSCGGQGNVKCPSCNGYGYTWVDQTYQESEWRTINGERRFVLVPKTRKVQQTCRECQGRRKITCKSCNGYGKYSCSSCNGKGYITCKTCKGEKILTCSVCSGKGRLVCKNCKGHREMLHGFAIRQQLDSEAQKRYVGDNRVLDWAKKANLCGVYELKTREKRKLNHDLFGKDSKCNAVLNGFLDETGRSDSNIIFQEASVLRCDVQYVVYNFEGKQYAGVIHQDVFYPFGSPIEDFADELIEKSEKKLAHGSSADALRLINQAGKAVGVNSRIRELRVKAEKHLDSIYSLGVELMFWLLALLFTPVLFNFYSNFNPVASWAVMANNPTWNSYHVLAFTQCLIFLVTILLLRIMIGDNSPSKHEYRSIWSYMLLGMGKYLGACILALVVLVGLNYVGLSIGTSWIVHIVIWALGLLLLLIIGIVAIVVKIVKWLIGVFF